MASQHLQPQGATTTMRARDLLNRHGAGGTRLHSCAAGVRADEAHGLADRELADRSPAAAPENQPGLAENQSHLHARHLRHEHEYDPIIVHQC
jgi:hypothetical protein